MVKKTNLTSNSINNWFRAYTDRFREEDGILHPMIQLKLSHSARVAAKCRAIAEATTWNDHEIALGEILGWVHDIGRFSQWKEFGTYQDAASVDHALRGCEVLQHEQVLAPLNDWDRHRILLGVEHHNRREIPSSIPPEKLSLCWLVRDADKLDILDLTYTHLVEGTLGELHPRLSRKLEANPVLLEEIVKRHRASYQNMHTLSDFVLVSISWMYDFNYGATARLASAQHVFSRMLPFLPNTTQVRELVEIAERRLLRLAEN